MRDDDVLLPLPEPPPPRRERLECAHVRPRPRRRQAPLALGRAVAVLVPAFLLVAGRLFIGGAAQLGTVWPLMAVVLGSSGAWTTVIGSWRMVSAPARAPMDALAAEAFSALAGVVAVLAAAIAVS